MQGRVLQGPQCQGIGRSRALVVHGAAHVRAALGLGCALLSAPGAAGYLGHAGFLALLRGGGWQGVEPAILDCGAAPGFGWAALMAGMPWIVLAPCPAWAAVEQAFPGRVLDRPPPARDLAAWDSSRGDGWLLEWARGPLG